MTLKDTWSRYYTCTYIDIINWYNSAIIGQLFQLNVYKVHVFAFDVTVIGMFVCKLQKLKLFMQLATLIDWLIMVRFSCWLWAFQVQILSPVRTSVKPAKESSNTFWTELLAGFNTGLTSQMCNHKKTLQQKHNHISLPS